MFSTFKYDKETHDIQELRSAFDPVTARSSQHQACNKCHVKKLRCSGEKSGCERCAASKLPCEYTRSNSRSSRRGKKSGGGTRSSSDSGSGDSSPGSQSGKSSSRHHRSRHSKHASKPSSSSSTSSRSHRDDNEDDNDGSALEQLDPSMLAPEDGFDLRSLSIAGESDIMGSPAGYGGGGLAAFSGTTTSDYYSPQVWQAAAIPQAAYGTSSYMMGSASGGYAEGEYYGYTDYTQFQHHTDARYWPDGGL